MQYIFNLFVQLLLISLVINEPCQEGYNEEEWCIKPLENWNNCDSQYCRDDQEQYNQLTTDENEQCAQFMIEGEDMYCELQQCLLDTYWYSWQQVDLRHCTYEQCCNHDDYYYDDHYFDEDEEQYHNKDDYYYEDEYYRDGEQYHDDEYHDDRYDNRRNGGKDDKDLEDKELNEKDIFVLIICFVFISCFCILIIVFLMCMHKMSSQQQTILVVPMQSGQMQMQPQMQRPIQIGTQILQPSQPIQPGLNIPQERINEGFQ